MIDFNKIPDWWALCPGYDCPRKEACLRHVALQQAPKKVTQWRCVLPTAIGDGECKLFRGAEKVEMAKGLHAIYSDIASKRARSCIRKHLTEFLGSKGTYYRYMDGERLLSPRLQQEIREIIHLYAPEAEGRFDDTFTDHDFT